MVMALISGEKSKLSNATLKKSGISHTSDE